MNGNGVGAPPRPWTFYSGSDRVVETSGAAQADDHRAWKNFGATSMNAISFGFVATAILISMFLIMAILEHLFRPNNHLSSSHDASLESRVVAHHKSRDHPMLLTTYARDISVVMPGHDYPTCLALPAPLLSCPPQGFRSPQPQHSFAFS
ncbi:hypothetical protein RND81_07G023600 [Saponaria officinalis]|uniref:Uncharacterized protein n=1 Tax=Saponaria officinalis TaxID=3572 RepID=A0AAW1JK02_SAPOF